MMDCTLSAHEALVDWLTGRIAGYLATSPAAIETDMAFGDFGLDSAFALNLCTDLETEFGIRVEPTVTWDYPTISDIAGHLAAQTRRVP
jgi:acyl carrier protein